MENPAEAAFLDHLYGAAADASRWVPALEAFADLTHGDSAYLSRLNLSTGEGPAVMARLDPAWKRAYDEHYSAFNPYSHAVDPLVYLRSWEPKVLTGDDWLREADLKRDTYYNEFMQPQDVHAVMFARLGVRDLDVSAITVNRPKDRGPFAAEDLAVARRLHPHMLRAFRLSETLAAAGGLAAGFETALAASPYALILLDETGAIVRANRPAERLLAGGHGLRAVRGRLSAVETKIDRRLQAGIAGALGLARRQSADLTIPGDGSRLPLSMSIAPTAADAGSVFQPPRHALVTVTDPNREVALSATQLRDQFGFTLAEVQVALELVRGRTVREIAESRGVSFHTVRNQLSEMLDKTGTPRQAELILLLMRANPPAAPF